jgi:hypothetical protein
MLPRTLLLVSLLAVATCADDTAAQGPAYQLLYSPPVSSNLGYMGSITEVDSSVFAVLSTWQSNNLDYARGLPLHRLWRDDRVPAR